MAHKNDVRLVKILEIVMEKNKEILEIVIEKNKGECDKQGSEEKFGC